MYNYIYCKNCSEKCVDFFKKAFLAPEKKVFLPALPRASHDILGWLDCHCRDTILDDFLDGIFAVFLE